MQKHNAMLTPLIIAAGVNPTIPAPANQTADVPIGNIKTFTLYALTASSSAQTIQLAMSGDTTNYRISTGANRIPFTDGSVTLTIPAGQNSVTVTLVDLTITNQIDTANLIATMTDANGTVTSNNLRVTFDNPTADANSGSAINGVLKNIYDKNHIITGTYYQYTGTAGADNIATNSGQNQVNSSDGNDLIVANGGSDIIIAGNGNNQIYANTQVDIPTALQQQQDFASTSGLGLHGSLISVGSGNNTIIGGIGNDAITTGNGNNLIVCGPGNVTVEGGLLVSSATMDWALALKNYQGMWYESSWNAATSTDTESIERCKREAANDTKVRMAA